MLYLPFQYRLRKNRKMKNAYISKDKNLNSNNYKFEKLANNFMPLSKIEQMKFFENHLRIFWYISIELIQVMIHTSLILVFLLEIKCQNSNTAINFSNDVSGLSHNNPMNPPETVNGVFSGAYYHHKGLGTHQGDTGESQIMFTSDALHHAAPSEIFISGPPQFCGTDLTSGAMNLNQLHQQMADGISQMHKASILKKEKEKEIIQLEAQIAQEKMEEKQEEVERLKQLDTVAEINEHKKPEVLGKKVIPVVSFTQETMPLRHHVRHILKMIDAVQATENANIDAQRQVARLDDITDKFESKNMIFDDANRYTAFRKAAGIEDTIPMDIPVLSINGNFYVTGGYKSHDPEVLLPNPPAFDGHTHFENHGRIGEGTVPQNDNNFPDKTTLPLSSPLESSRLPPAPLPPPLQPQPAKPSNNAPYPKNLPQFLDSFPTIDNINNNLSTGLQTAKIKTDMIKRLTGYSVK